MCLNPFRVKVFEEEEFTCLVDHRLCLAVFVDEVQWRDVGLFCHSVIVGTECRSDMDYACTVFCCDVIAWDDTESVAVRSHPRDERLVVEACEVFAFACAQNFVRELLVADFPVFKCRFFSFCREERCHQRLSDDDVNLLAVVRVNCLHEVVFDAGTHCQCCVRRQCPRCCGPSHDLHVVEIHVNAEWQFFKLTLFSFQAEHRHAGEVFHVAVAAWHVQLV